MFPIHNHFLSIIVYTILLFIQQHKTLMKLTLMSSRTKERVSCEALYSDIEETSIHTTEWQQ